MNIIKRILSKVYDVLNDKVKQTNWYKNQLVDTSLFPTNDWYRNNTERNFDIVNIGSSSAVFAFDYTQINTHGLNWAGKPQSLELGFKIIKNFFSILRKDGIVCIPLSPFTGLAVPWAGKDEEDRFYGIMDYSLFENYPKVAFKMGNPLRYNPKESLKRLIKDIPIKKEYSITQLNKDDFECDAANWIAIWKNEFGLQDLYAPVPEHLKEGMRKRITLMSDIVSFCRERELRPVVLLAPIHRALAAYFSEPFKEQYLQPIINTAENNGAIIIDMMNSKDFETSDFYNSFFLNSIGSKKFMKILEKFLS